MVKEHGSKEISNLLKALEKMDFTVSRKTTKGTVKITPPPGTKGPVYFTHGTQSSFHQIKRDFRRLYGVEL